MEQLADAMGGRGKTVLISGLAGIGKTRLCEAFESLAVRAGCMSLIGRCLPGAPRPFLPFEEAFKRPAESVFEAAAIGIGGRVRQSSFFDSQTQSERYLSGILDALKVLSGKRPVVLRLEDLQWGDSASIQALNFMARNLGGVKALIIGTFRTEDLERSANGRPHTLLEHARALKQDGLVEELALEPLGPSDLRVAMESLLDGKVDDELSDLVFSESGGVPLFAVELVRLMAETGELALEGGSWTRPNAGAAPVPATVQEVILRRTDRLPWTTRRVLECGSVIGGTFDPSMVTEVLDLPSSETTEELQYLEFIHHLLVRVGERYRFSHEKVQRVTYESVSRPMVRELHRRVALCLEARGGPGQSYGDLANHFCKGGEADKCLRYSFLAGEMHWSSCGFIEAIPHLSRVLTLTDGRNGQDERALRAREHLGDARFQLQDYDGAQRQFLIALREAEGAQKPRLLRKVAECWLMGNLGWDMRLANCLIEEAEGCHEIEPVELGEIYHFRARTALWTGKYEEAERYHFMAEEQFQEASLHDRLAWEMELHGIVNASQERYDEALDRYLKALDIFAEHPYKTGEMEARFSLGELMFVRGRYEDALNQIMRSNEMASQIGDHYSLRFGHLTLSWIYSELGDMEKAMAHVMRSVDEGKKERAQYVLNAPAFLAHLLVLEGRADEAKAIIAWVQRTIDENFAGIKTPLKGVAKVVMGEIMAAQGHYAESDALFREGLDLFTDVTAGSNYRAIAHVWYGNVLRRQSRTEEAKEEFSKAMGLFERNGNEAGRDKAAALIVHSAGSDRLWANL